MVFYGEWWWMMVFYGERWCFMVNDSEWWLSMVNDGVLWWLLTSNFRCLTPSLIINRSNHYCSWCCLMIAGKSTLNHSEIQQQTNNFRKYWGLVLVDVVFPALGLMMNQGFFNAGNGSWNVMDNHNTWCNCFSSRMRVCENGTPLLRQSHRKVGHDPSDEL